MGLIERLRSEHGTLAGLIAAAAKAADAIEALCGYAEHDPDCEDMTGAYPGSCTCGFSRLMAEIRGDD